MTELSPHNPYYLCKHCGERYGVNEFPPPLNACRKCGEASYETFRPDVVCDFCTSVPVMFSYPCRTFVQESPGSLPDFGSNGWWAACTNCHRLIAKSDRDGLVKRALRKHIQRHPEIAAIKSELRGTLREMFDRFWANREGLPIEHAEPQTKGPQL